MDFENWYNRIPAVTRIYITLVALTSLGCQLKLFNKYQLFFTWPLFWQEGQYWRLLTTYLYFGSISIDTLFHLYFLLQYCQNLEDDFYRGKKPEFLYFILFSMVSITTLSVAFNLNQFIPFLSSSLTFTLTYLWSRRNPALRISFLGVFTFNAPYLPFTLIGFTLLLHSSIPWADCLGLVVGHFYYFFEDVFPNMPASNGARILGTPGWFKRLFERQVAIERIPDLRMEDVDPVPLAQ
ncbi:hypothetical protein HDV01_003085 [Terramyces sp. JEL0728]|nr:hypothetical protein HDV01_003085 [Terramyces sp. JEL0728]